MFPNPSGGECEYDGNTKKDKRTEVSMKKYTHEKAHEEIDYIFKTLLPQRGMAERPEQIRLCHSILDAMLDGSIALCDAGTGIGKTFAYLTAGILHGRCRAAEGKPQRPILISTSSIALQSAIQKEYLPLLSSVLLSEGLISAPIEAGIRKGDVIVEIDGLKINDAATLQEQIARHRPNDKVKLSVKRDGAVKQFEVTLRNKAGKTELMTKEDVDVVEVLGGKFADAGTKLCRELDIRGGVQVVGVKQGGILSRARVKQGFVITHINDAPVYSLSDMERMTEKIRSAPASAVSRKLPCWVNWLSGAAACRTKTR